MINGSNVVPSGTFQFAQVNPASGGTFSGFIGFVSDTALITSLRLDSPGTGVENFTLDNLRYASGTANPGSWWRWNVRSRACFH